jgi:hypothetical protein
MSFNLEEYVYLSPWLQMVGVIVAFGGLMGAHGAARWIGFLGLGMAIAGRLYRYVYP